MLGTIGELSHYATCSRVERGRGTQPADTNCREGGQKNKQDNGRINVGREEGDDQEWRGG